MSCPKRNKNRFGVHKCLGSMRTVVCPAFLVSVAFQSAIGRLPEASRSPNSRLWRAIGRLSVACRTAIGGFRSAIDSQNGVPESITCSRTSLSQAGAGCR